MVAPVYLTVDEFKLRTIIDPAQVDVLIAHRTGFLERTIDMRSRWLDARLRKRYATPFNLPAPSAIIGWLVAIVTKDALLALGTNAPDEQVKDIFESATTSLAEVKEAADEENGLFDLPVRDADNASALEEAAPLGTSEASVYDWIDKEALAIDGSTSGRPF